MLPYPAVYGFKNDWLHCLFWVDLDVVIFAVSVPNTVPGRKQRLSKHWMLGSM